MRGIEVLLHQANQLLDSLAASDLHGHNLLDADRGRSVQLPFLALLYPAFLTGGSEGGVASLLPLERLLTPGQDLLDPLNDTSRMGVVVVVETATVGKPVRVAQHAVELRNTQLDVGVLRDEVLGPGLSYNQGQGITYVLGEGEDEDDSHHHFLKPIIAM